MSFAGNEYCDMERSRVELDIGGTRHVTSVSTLRSRPGSMLDFDYYCIELVEERTMVLAVGDYGAVRSPPRLVDSCCIDAPSTISLWRVYDRWRAVRHGRSNQNTGFIKARIGVHRGSIWGPYGVHRESIEGP